MAPRDSGSSHLAVAHEGPDLAALGVEQAAVVEVFHEPGLVDRHQRSEPMDTVGYCQKPGINQGWG